MTLIPRRSCVCIWWWCSFFSLRVLLSGVDFRPDTAYGRPVLPRESSVFVHSLPGMGHLPPVAGVGLSLAVSGHLFLEVNDLFISILFITFSFSLRDHLLWY